MARGRLLACGLTLVFIATPGARPVWPATAASGSTTITVTPGNSVAMRVAPTSLVLVEDVVAPGSDWMFQSSPQPWFPAGVSEVWVYAASGSIRCATVAVLTYKESYALTAFATISSGTAPLAVYVAETGSSCAAPSARATRISTSSGNPTVLSAGLGHSLTKYYSLLIAPVGGAAVGGTTTITITWAAQ